MNSPFYPRDIYGDEGGSKVDFKRSDANCQIAGDGSKVFKGRRDVEHLAYRGWEIPSTNRSGLSHVCEDWDKALEPDMSPPEPHVEYVTMDFFRWIAYGVTVYMVSLGVTVGKLAAMLRGHRVKVEGIETRLTKEHQENTERLIQMKGDLMEGQKRLQTTMDATRRTVDDVMLQRARGGR